jgi:hypothetical protein
VVVLDEVMIMELLVVVVQTLVAAEVVPETIGEDVVLIVAQVVQE